MFQYGRDQKKSTDEAYQLFEQAKPRLKKEMEQSNVDSIYLLGLMFYKGYGSQNDYAQAKQLFSKTADLGHAEALCYLGDMYYEGNGV